MFWILEYVILAKEANKMKWTKTFHWIGQWHFKHIDCRVEHDEMSGVDAFKLHLVAFSAQCHTTSQSVAFWCLTEHQLLRTGCDSWQFVEFIKHLSVVTKIGQLRNKKQCFKYSLAKFPLNFSQDSRTDKPILSLFHHNFSILSPLFLFCSDLMHT